MTSLERAARAWCIMNDIPEHLWPFYQDLHQVRVAALGDAIIETMVAIAAAFRSMFK